MASNKVQNEIFRHPGIGKAALALRLGVAALVLLPASPSLASSRSSAEQVQLAAARALVEEYQDLRRHCAEQTGDERRSCFHQLHANNSEYRLAKQQLKLGVTEDRDNVHLVTF